MNGQVILSHGVAAAAGSTAGGMAGKQVSNILDKVNGVTVQAAGVPAASKPMVRGPVWTPEVKTAAPTRVTVVTKRRTAPKEPVIVASVPAMPALVDPREVSPVIEASPPREPSAVEIGAIQPGAERQAVIEQLGPTAARVSIPEEGGMLEIWSYSNGSVRLVNGVVSSVRVN